MVVKDDQDWQMMVTAIARGSADKDCVMNASAYSYGLCVLTASGYLWDEANWSRLKGTPHGRFLREVVSICPDYGLRSAYRKEVLNGETTW